MPLHQPFMSQHCYCGHFDLHPDSPERTQGTNCQELVCAKETPALLLFSISIDKMSAPFRVMVMQKMKCTILHDTTGFHKTVCYQTNWMTESLLP